jgi:hypothetical protein
MIKRFINWVKGLWTKPDMTDEERAELQMEMFINRLKKNAFYERTEPMTIPEALMAARTNITVSAPTPEFSTDSKKVADEFDQIPWARLTDEAKKDCISIARTDIAKQSNILTKLHETL